jgi:chromosomal replication initiator protein
MTHYTAPGIESVPNLLIMKASLKYNVSVEQIKSKTRRQPIAESRQYAAWLIRENTNMTFKEIGNFMNTDHATIMYSCKTIKERIQRNQLLIQE